MEKIINGGDKGKDMKFQGQVWNHICGIVDSMVLKTTLEFNIFDIIHTHTKSMTTFSNLFFFF